MKMTGPFLLGCRLTSAVGYFVVNILNDKMISYIVDCQYFRVVMDYLGHNNKMMTLCYLLREAFDE